MVKVGDDVLGSLQVATPEDMDGLLDKLQQWFPESATIRGALLARKAFKGISEVYETKIYHSHKSSLVVATPTFSQKGIRSISIFWDTDAEDDVEVIRLLLTIPEINWTQPVFLYSTPLVVLEKMQKMVERGAIGEGFLRPHKASICHLYSINDQPPDETSLPEGFELRPLSDAHAEFVHSHWKYNFSEPIDDYTKLLRVAPAIGIFKSEYNSSTIDGNNRNVASMRDLKPDSLASGSINGHEATTDVISNNDQDLTRKKEPKHEDNPVAWSHLSQFNTLTNTFTLEKYRGHKFGRIVSNAIIKRSLQETGIVSSCIDDDNVASVKMHEKMGFVKQHALGYQYYKSLKTDCVVDKGTPFS